MDFYSIQTKIKNEDYKDDSYYREDLLQAIQDSVAMSKNQAMWIYLNAPKCEGGYDMSEDCFLVQAFSFKIREFLNITD